MSQPSKTLIKLKDFNLKEQSQTDCLAPKIQFQIVQNPQSLKVQLSQTLGIPAIQFQKFNLQNQNLLLKNQSKQNTQFIQTNSLSHQTSSLVVQSQSDSNWIIVQPKQQIILSQNNLDLTIQAQQNIMFLKTMNSDQLLDDSSIFSTIQKKLLIEESLFQYLKLYKRREFGFFDLIQQMKKGSIQSRNIKKDKIPFVKFSARELLIFGFNTEETKNYIKCIQNYCKSVSLLQTNKSNSIIFKMLLMTNIQNYLFKAQVHIFKSKTRGCYLLAGRKTQNQLLNVWKNISCFQYKFLVLPNFLNKQPYLTIVSLVFKLQTFIKHIQKYQIYGIQVVSYEKQKAIRQSEIKKQKNVLTNLFCLIKTKSNYESFSQIKVSMQICQFIKSNYKYLVFKIEQSPKFIEKSQLKTIKLIVIGSYLTLVWQIFTEKQQKIKLMKYLTDVQFKKIVYVDNTGKNKLKDLQMFEKEKINSVITMNILAKLLDIEQEQQQIVRY